MSYRKITLLITLAVACLLLLMTIVNTLAPAPTYENQGERITRYYHNHPNSADAYKPLAQIATLLLALYAKVLGGLGAGAYQFFNILIYAVLWPALMVFLTYWALRPLRKEPEQ